MSPPRAPLFLIGAPRSGTTIVHEALARHEAAGWITSFSRRFPGLWPLDATTRVLDIPGLRLQGEKRQHGQGRGRLNRLVPKPAEAYDRWERLCGSEFRRGYLLGVEASAEQKTRTRRAIRRLLRLQGKEQLISKLTGPPRIHFLRSIFPEARFVHITRDPRIVVHSLLEVSFWKAGGGYEEPWWRGGLPENWTEEWDRYERSPAALAALQWRRIVELADTESRELEEGAFLEISYEAFVADPVKSTRRISAFAGLPRSAAVETYVSEEGRYRNMNRRHIADLDPSDRAAIDAITASWLPRYGDPALR